MTGARLGARVRLHSRMRRTLLLVAPPPPPAACGTRARETARIPPSWQFSNVAPPVVGETAMVASEHPLASQIGAEIMRRGGNATDAAVAVGFAQVVVNPRAGNIGGGGFLVYRTARGEVYALDYRETAPAAASRTMYLDSAGNVPPAPVVRAPAAGRAGAGAGGGRGATSFCPPSPSLATVTLWTARALT